MTSMKTKKKLKKKIILFWKHMINRVFSRDFCSGMVLFTCRILIGNISRVTSTSSFQIVFPRPLWFHATECCVFRFKSVPTWWLCGPIGACAARLSPARIFVLLSSSLLMPRGEIYLRLKPYLVVKIASDVLTEHCCQVCVLAMIFCRSDCRLCAGHVSDCAITENSSIASVPRVLACWHSDRPTWDMKNILYIWFLHFTLTEKDRC